MFKWATPYGETYPTEINVSHAQHGELLCERMPIQNWLDPLRTAILPAGVQGIPPRATSGFDLPYLFEKPTQAQINRGALGWFGGIREIDVLDAQQTGLPQLSVEELMALTIGPYQVSQARSYLDRMHVATTNEHHSIPGNYVNHATYHLDCEGGLRNRRVRGYVFNQIQPPAMFYGTWHGNAAPHQNMPWEPVRILIVPDILSRHQAGTKYCAVIAYVPMHLNVQHQTPGRTSANTHRIKMWACGPRTGNGCPIGTRTVSPCSHATTALYAGCVVAHNPAIHKTTHRRIAAMDPGTSLPIQHSTEIVSGLHS